MPNPHLRPTAIVDANGRQTTVYRKVDDSNGQKNRAISLAPTVARPGATVAGGMNDIDYQQVNSLITDLAEEKNVPEGKIDNIVENVASYIESITTGESEIAYDGKELGGKWYRDENYDSLHDLLGEITNDGLDAGALHNFAAQVARHIDKEIKAETPAPKRRSDDNHWVPDNPLAFTPFGVATGIFNR